MSDWRFIMLLLHAKCFGPERVNNGCQNTARTSYIAVQSRKVYMLKGGKNKLVKQTFILAFTAVTK